MKTMCINIRNLQVDIEKKDALVGKIEKVLSSIELEFNFNQISNNLLIKHLIIIRPEVKYLFWCWGKMDLFFAQLHECNTLFITGERGFEQLHDAMRALFYSLRSLSRCVEKYIKIVDYEEITDTYQEVFDLLTIIEEFAIEGMSVVGNNVWSIASDEKLKKMVGLYNFTESSHDSCILFFEHSPLIHKKVDEIFFKAGSYILSSDRSDILTDKPSGFNKYDLIEFKLKSSINPDYIHSWLKAPFIPLTCYEQIREKIFYEESTLSESDIPDFLTYHFEKSQKNNNELEMLDLLKKICGEMDVLPPLPIDYERFNVEIVRCITRINIFSDWLYRHSNYNPNEIVEDNVSQDDSKTRVGFITIFDSKELGKIFDGLAAKQLIKSKNKNSFIALFSNNFENEKIEWNDKPYGNKKALFYLIYKLTGQICDYTPKEMERFFATSARIHGKWIKDYKPMPLIDEIVDSIRLSIRE